MGLAVTALAASRPGEAHAETRTTLMAQTAGGGYGAAVAIAGRDPDTQMPVLTTPVPTAWSPVPLPRLPTRRFRAAVVGTGNLGRGVTGLSNSNYGVLGVSTSSVGVRGEIPVTSAANAIAVYGSELHRHSPVAVRVRGVSGFTASQPMGMAWSVRLPRRAASAVVGATNGVAGAYAAAFYGPVFVGGDFTVVGGAKSAAVPHPDGSHRRLVLHRESGKLVRRLRKGHARVRSGRGPD